MSKDTTKETNAKIIEEITTQIDLSEKFLFEHPVSKAGTKDISEIKRIIKMVLNLFELEMQLYLVTKVYTSDDYLLLNDDLVHQQEVVQAGAEEALEENSYLIEEIIPLLNVLIHKDKKDAEAWIMFGNALGELKENELMLACYEHAISIDPKNYSSSKKNCENIRKMLEYYDQFVPVFDKESVKKARKENPSIKIHNIKVGKNYLKNLKTKREKYLKEVIKDFEPVIGYDSFGSRVVYPNKKSAPKQKDSFSARDYLNRI